MSLRELKLLHLKVSCIRNFHLIIVHLFHNNFSDVRLIPSPNNVASPSPMPALRNTSLNSNQNHEEIQQTRSPIPTPRNRETRLTNQGNYRNLPSIIVNPSSSDNDNDRLRRQNAVRSSLLASRSSAPLQRGLQQAENSPTARLIHKLFRNRDPAFLPGPSSSSPVVSRRSNENPTTIPQPEISASISNATAPMASNDNNGNDSDSEYHSIETLSLILDLSRSITPPPAYKSIFIDEEANVIK